MFHSFNEAGEQRKKKQERRQGKQRSKSKRENSVRAGINEWEVGLGKPGKGNAKLIRFKVIVLCTLLNFTKILNFS